MNKNDRLLRMGVLGCGPIAQMAHLDVCRKACNTELYAICDVAEDLVAKMAAVHDPKVTYTDFDAMLADPKLEAVIIATTDAFHVPLSLKAIAAGKHVLVEKPLGVSVEECEQLRTLIAEKDVRFQIGNNWRFDPGFRYAQNFIQSEMGERIGLKVWYYDSTDRYTMTDNLLPNLVISDRSQKTKLDPKADRQRYLLMTHGSHAVDVARFVGGPIKSVSARYLERSESHTWFTSLEFADGCLGHIDISIPQRGDVEFGFRAFGQNGSVLAKGGLIWYHKSSYVECFSQKDGLFRRPMGADSYSYRLQLEAFADCILTGAVQHGADAEDGTAAVRTLVAISHSAKENNRTVKIDDVGGTV